MAVTVETARAILADSILHTGSSTFSDTKKDRAILSAVNRFLRETRLNRKKQSISITSGTISYSLATLEAAGTNLDNIMGTMHIAPTDWREVKLVDYDTIREQHDDHEKTGHPELVGVDGDNLVVYPTPDANYTLTAQTFELQDMTDWTVGDGGATTLAATLSVPDRWVDDVLWFGARGYLLFGAPGHPDAAPAMKEFTRVIIPNAKGEGGAKSIDPSPRRKRFSSLYSQGYNP